MEKLKLAHEALEQTSAELALLRDAIKQNDPKSELLVRVQDMERRCARACQRSCVCLNVNMGSYANQARATPPWGGRPVGIDRCVLDEIRALWNMGIRTVESCCGHNLTAGYIAVTPEHDSAMVELGYLRDRATTAPHVFLPQGRAALSKAEGREGEG